MKFLYSQWEIAINLENEVTRNFSLNCEADPRYWVQHSTFREADRSLANGKHSLSFIKSEFVLTWFQQHSLLPILGHMNSVHVLHHTFINAYISQVVFFPSVFPSNDKNGCGYRRSFFSGESGLSQRKVMKHWNSVIYFWITKITNATHKQTASFCFDNSVFLRFLTVWTFFRFISTHSVAF